MLITRVHLKSVFVLLTFGVMLAMLRPSSAQSAKVDFQRDIQPILQANCWRCHGEQKASGQLRLDSKSAAMKGGISGAVIIAGNSKSSRLLHRVRGEGGEKRMPLGGEALSSAHIELLARWIDEGAVWLEGDGATGRRGECFAKTLGFCEAGSLSGSTRQKRELGSEPDRCFCAGAIGKRRGDTFAGSRPRDVAAPVESGFDRLAADD